MKPELRERIIAYNKAKQEKEDMAHDLSDILKRLFKIYDLLKPLIPDEVKAIFKKYGYDKE
jgi:DNA-directed RNA polymerase subunit F